MVTSALGGSFIATEAQMEDRWPVVTNAPRSGDLSALLRLRETVKLLCDPREYWNWPRTGLVLVAGGDGKAWDIVTQAFLPKQGNELSDAAAGLLNAADADSKALFPCKSISDLSTVYEFEEDCPFAYLGIDKPWAALDDRL